MKAGFVSIHLHSCGVTSNMRRKVFLYKREQLCYQRETRIDRKKAFSKSKIERNYRSLKQNAKTLCWCPCQKIEYRSKPSIPQTSTSLALIPSFKPLFTR